eukprot:3933169-Rhodomonas_salina.2
MTRKSPEPPQAAGRRSPRLTRSLISRDSDTHWQSLCDARDDVSAQPDSEVRRRASSGPAGVRVLARRAGLPVTVFSSSSCQWQQAGPGPVSETT